MQKVSQNENGREDKKNEWKKWRISIYTAEWNEWLDHSLSICMEHSNATELILQTGLLMLEDESRQVHLNYGFFIYLKPVCAGLSVTGNCEI